MRRGFGFSGFGFNAPNGLSVSASAPAYTAEALALFARMSPTPGTTRKGVINTLILSLLTGATSGTNIWAKIDVLYVLAADAEANALLEWKGAVLYNAVKNGTPNFTVDRGFTSTVGTDFLNTSYNPALVSLGMTQDSAHIGLYVTTDVASAVDDIGNGNTSHRIRGGSSTNNALAALNDGAGGLAQITTPTAPNFIVGSRTGSTTFTVYRNGGSPVTNATASSTVAGNLYILNGNGSSAGTGRRQAVAHEGQGLNAAEALDSYNAFKAYLTAIGSPA